ncbi:MAG: YihY/virulence factor BrkB family protein [Polyangiaceae bacterium]
MLRASVSLFARRGGGFLGGSVAFYCLLSILPVLFIALSLARLGSHETLAREALVGELARWLGPKGALTIADLLDSTPAAGALPTRLFHAAVVLYMSTRLFSLLRRSINHLWGIETAPAVGVKQSLLGKLERLLWALFVVLLIEALLLALVAAKATLAVAGARFPTSLPTLLLAQAGETLLSFGVVTLLFAALLRFLPDARIAWRDLWRGALITATLFTFGTTLVARYVSHKTLDSELEDGAALIALLLWANYSAQIFFLGVSFTGVWADRRGQGIQPLPSSRRVPVTEETTNDAEKAPPAPASTLRCDRDMRDG